MSEVGGPSPDSSFDAVVSRQSEGLIDGVPVMPGPNHEVLPVSEKKSTNPPDQVKVGQIVVVPRSNGEIDGLEKGWVVVMVIPPESDDGEYSYMVASTTNNATKRVTLSDLLKAASGSQRIERDYPINSPVTVLRSGDGSLEMDWRVAKYITGPDGAVTAIEVTRPTADGELAKTVHPIFLDQWKYEWQNRQPTPKTP